MADNLPDVDQAFPDPSTKAQGPPPDVDSLFPPQEEEARRYRAINTGTERPSPVQDLLFKSDSPFQTVWRNAGRIAEAFGHGFTEAGPAEAMSQEDRDALKNWIGFDKWREWQKNLGRAVNNVLIQPAAYDLSLVSHTVSGAITGTQGAIAALGEQEGFPQGPGVWGTRRDWFPALPGVSPGQSRTQFFRDVAAIPEALQGSPHPTGMPHEVSPGAVLTQHLESAEPVNLPPSIFEARRRKFTPRDLADAAALRVIGPDGEAGYLGTKISEGVAEFLRRGQPPEQAPPPAPDLHAMVRQANPQLFEEYDALTHRRDILRRFIDDREDTGRPDPTLRRVVTNLQEAETRLRELAPQVQDAYRKAEGDLPGPLGLRAMLDRGASLDELTKHPMVMQADAENKRRLPTGTEEDFADPEWRARRTYDFDGEKVQGTDAAVERLTEKAKAYSTEGPVENGRHAIIVIGPPAAEKSSISIPLAKKYRAAIIDADDANEVIPEHQKGLGTQAVHEESSVMAKGMIERLSLEGSNIILPKVGEDADSIRRLTTRLHEIGYNVDLVHVAATPEISGRRNIQRFLDKGRLVAPDYLASVGDKPRQNYHILKREGLFNETADFDTSGETPRLVDGADSAIEAAVARGQREGAGRTPAGGAEEGTEPAPPASLQAEVGISEIAAKEASRLMAAGIPRTEAQAAGLVQAHMWEARSRAFAGKKGTALEMYEREAPEIRGGPGVRPVTPELVARAEAALAKAEQVAPARPEPAAVTPADAAIPPQDRAAPIPHALPNDVRTFAPGDLKVDARRFQFKGGGDEAGVTDRLKGVKKWNDTKAGLVLVWEDREGNHYIVDGHQRHALATRIAREDPAQSPRLLARVIREADGYTDVDARVDAAAKNIAEGTGTAVDAAKIFRDRPHLINDLPPRSALVRDARGLVNLSKDAFGMVINEVVPEQYAAIVGKLVPQDAQLQQALLGLLAKAEPANAVQAEAIIRQGIDAGLAEVAKAAQGSLFGDEHLATSLYGERAKVLDRALKELRRDKTVFSVLTREQETIRAAGNKLAAEINEKRAAADAQALQILQILASRKGPISDALNAAAKRARTDGKPGAAAADFVAEVRRLVQTGDLARLADGVERGPTHVGAEDAAKLVEPAAERISPEAEAKAAAEVREVIQEGTLFQRRRRGPAEGQGDLFGKLESATERVEANPADQAARAELRAMVDATRAGPQIVMPGMERSAAQAAAAREAAGRLTGARPQQEAGGLFAERPQGQAELFQESRRQLAPPFYSAVERAVTSATQAKASPEQWLGMLKNMPGVKPEEMEWLGLADWLKEQKGPVTREEIADYIRANRIDVREVEKGNDAARKAAIETASHEAAQARFHIMELERAGATQQEISIAHNAYLRAQDRVAEARQRNQVTEPKFASYQLPGGENYRELLLTLPPEQFEKPIGEGPFAQVPFAERFRDTHWDEPNPIGWARMNDRVIDGKKTLLIEEVQETQQIKKWRALHKKIKEGNATEEDIAAAAAIEKQIPFVRNWHELIMKRMIRYAAEHGYDKIAWTTGETQAERYDLSKQISKVTYDKKTQKLVALDLHKNRVLDKTATPDELPDIIGKEAADRLLDNPTQKVGEWHSLEGLDLKVGGEGMKGFYDQILPATVNKLTKKFGGRVGEGETPVGEARRDKISGRWYVYPETNEAPGNFATKEEAEAHAQRPVHTLDITDKLRDAATEQGFPLFQRGGSSDIKKGKFQAGAGPDARDVITYFKDADASTLIHEPGHFWLFRMAKDAADPEASAQLKADFATTLKWLGADKAEDLNERAANGKLTARAVRFNEKFARGFEAYVMEGWAPSQALARVFEQFRQWLTKIYGSLKQLEAEAGFRIGLSDEMRAVFDRMLAAEPRQRPVIAPEAGRAAEPGGDLAAIHEADAAHPEPANPHAVAETIQAERDSLAGQHLVDESDAEARLADVAPETRRREAGGAQSRGNVAAPGPVEGQARPPEEPGTQRAGGGEAAPEGAGGGAGGGPEQPPAKPTAPAGALTEPPAGPAQPFESTPPLIDKAGNIRLDKLDTPEDVKRVIRDAAEKNNAFLDARRGVVSDAEVLDLADALGMDAEQLNRRRIGQAFNAEEITAARKLLVQSATAVRDAMAKAADGNEADILAFAEARERHLMIQEQVAGITAEAGRALRAFRFMAGAREAKAIGDFLRDATGGMTLFQLQRMAKLGSALPTPQQVSQFVHNSAKPNFADMLLEYWVNALISGPATHTTYMIGNELLALNKAGPETAVAAAIGSIRRAFGDHGPRVYWGEVPAQLFGMISGIPKGIVAAWEAAKTGRTTALPGELAGLSAAQLARSPLVATRAAIPDFTVGGVPVPVGTFLRLPSRGVAMIHSLFRAMNYEREMAALAYRDAAARGLTGQARAAHIASVVANPAADLMEQARASATDLTLMGRGGALTQNLSRLTNTRFFGGQWLKFIDPFVHISSNVIEQAILQRTIVGVIDPEIRANLSGANGPVARDMTIARMLVGTSIGVGVGALAAQGLVNGSGPSDPHERAIATMVNGPPHSIRIGDMWYDIHRLGPLGMQFGIAADIYHLADVIGKEDAAKVASELSHAFTQNILDESFMRGPAELMRALSDPDRYGAGWVRNFVSSFLPFSVGEGQIARAIDPWSRSARTTLDAVKAKAPWLSQTLLPRRDVFGEPVPNKDALGLAGLTAIYEERVKNDPVARAMLDAGYFPAMPNRKIRDVELTDQQYDDYCRISGRLAKVQLDQMVRSPGFSEMPPGFRHDKMREIVTQSRQLAENMVLMKNPDIIKAARDAKVAKLRGEKVH